MRGLDGDGKVGGSTETEGRASARPEHAAVFVSYGVPRKHVPLASARRIKPSDPLLFPEQSIG
jgi:hypothetical protein